MRLRFQFSDGIAIAAVALLALALFFLPGRSTPAASAQIYQDGTLITTLSLDIDQEFVAEGKYTNVITVRDGKIAVTRSDCPGADCVNCGWISTAGRSIVCLPNGLEIRVLAQGGDVDFVVG